MIKRVQEQRGKRRDKFLWQISVLPHGTIGERWRPARFEESESVQLELRSLLVLVSSCRVDVSSETILLALLHR